MIMKRGRAANAVFFSDYVVDLVTHPVNQKWGSAIGTNAETRESLTRARLANQARAAMQPVLHFCRFPKRASNFLPTKKSGIEKLGNYQYDDTFPAWHVFAYGPTGRAVGVAPCGFLLAGLSSINVVQRVGNAPFFMLSECLGRKESKDRYA